ncbi:hypothetical protein B0T18DRAFT_397618 [Schizothecium vesticola]|uniref:Uncharacterized protein n=1 Tax=Schizothecium vesticola TaxID=314040 RepID=A0AA40F9N0_9PEZI|nr:hypothetical protein B0T18DRAFT_397618 [Schizothecium vesticola]
MSSRPGGIQSDQDVFRKPVTYPTGDLKIKTERPVAVCADSCPGGVLYVAYLMSGSSVATFRVDPGLGGTPRPAAWTKIQIDQGSSNKWTGVALGGEYIAVWGMSGKGTRALVSNSLKVIRIISNKESSFLELPHRAIECFDADKRVAVSRLGYVALISDRTLVVIDLNSTPAKVSTMKTPRTPQPFDDVAFSEKGDLLYAWAAASLEERSAGLFVYRADSSAGGKFQNVSQSYYNPSFGDSFDAKLIPYNTRIGCIIAAGSMYYYPAVTNAGPRSGSDRQRRNVSEDIRKSHLSAFAMYNDHSLVAIRRTDSVFRPRYRLVEHPLRCEGASSPYFDDSIQLAKVRVKVGGRSEIRAVQAGGDICVFIFTLDGRYETIRFEGPRARPREDPKKKTPSPTVDRGEPTVSEGRVIAELDAAAPESDSRSTITRTSEVTTVVGSP